MIDRIKEADADLHRAERARDRRGEPAPARSGRGNRENIWLTADAGAQMIVLNKDTAEKIFEKIRSPRHWGGKNS